jgi:hypothetical protein
MAISSDVWSLPGQHNPFAIIENGTFDRERNLPAVCVKKKCDSGEVSVGDLTSE